MSSDNGKYFYASDNYSSKDCKDFKLKLQNQVEAVDNYSDDEAQLEKVLEQYPNPGEEGSDLENEGTIPETTLSGRPSEAADIFTEKATVDYPHVTPIQKHQMLMGVKKAIAGIFEFHTQNADDTSKEITAEDVKGYLEKLKKGEIIPKTPGKKNEK